MIDLAEKGDFFLKAPLINTPPQFRDGVSFHYTSAIDDESLFQESINLFNSEIEWDNMWTISDVYDRFDKGHLFTYMKDSNGVLGYMWRMKNYTYNFFVSNRRENRDILDFVNMNRYLQYKNGYDYEVLYVSWHNIHVLNLMKKRFGCVEVDRSEVELELKKQ